MERWQISFSFFFWVYEKSGFASGLTWEQASWPAALPVDRTGNGIDIKTLMVLNCWLFTIYRMWWFFKITCCWSNSALCYVTDKRPPDLLLMAIGTMIVVKPHTCKQFWKFFFCLFLVWRKYKLNVFSKPPAVTCPFCFCLWKQRLGLVQDRPQRNIEVEFFFNVF